MHEEYCIRFNDGTITLLWVDQDEELDTAIVDMCEDQGWNVQDVTKITPTGNHTNEVDDDE